jgi:hypothetical protein
MKPYFRRIVRLDNIQIVWTGLKLPWMNSQRIWSSMAVAIFECDSEKLASAIVLEKNFWVNAIGARNAQRVSANSTENGKFITTKMRAFFFFLPYLGQQIINAFALPNVSMIMIFKFGHVPFFFKSILPFHLLSYSFQDPGYPGER